MVAILYLEVNLLRKNSKKYHTRQNARKPHKTAKNKHRLTGVKNTAKPLINRVIQQPRWRRNATNRQTRRARTMRRQQDNHHAPTRETPCVNTRALHHADARYTQAGHTHHQHPRSGTITHTHVEQIIHTLATSQKSAAPPPQKRGKGDAHTHTTARSVSAPNDHDARRISSTRSRSASVKEMSPSGQRPAARFCARRPSRYTASDSPRS